MSTNAVGNRTVGQVGDIASNHEAETTQGFNQVPQTLGEPTLYESILETMETIREENRELAIAICAIHIVLCIGVLYSVNLMNASQAITTAIGIAGLTTAYAAFVGQVGGIASNNKAETTQEFNQVPQTLNNATSYKSILKNIETVHEENRESILVLCAMSANLSVGMLYTLNFINESQAIAVTIVLGLPVLYAILRDHVNKDPLAKEITAIPEVHNADIYVDTPSLAIEIGTLEDGARTNFASSHLSQNELNRENRTIIDGFC